MKKQIKKVNKSKKLRVRTNVRAGALRSYLRLAGETQGDILG
jgi:hypothetical protein